MGISGAESHMFRGSRTLSSYLTGHQAPPEGLAPAHDASSLLFMRSRENGEIYVTLRGDNLGSERYLRCLPLSCLMKYPRSAWVDQLRNARFANLLSVRDVEKLSRKELQAIGEMLQRKSLQ
jgi:hypothetical protein